LHAETRFNLLRTIVGAQGEDGARRAAAKIDSVGLGATSENLVQFVGELLIKA